MITREDSSAVCFRHVLPGPPPQKISSLSREQKAVVLFLPASMPKEHEQQTKGKKILNNLRGELVAKPTGLKRTAISRDAFFSG